MSLISNFFPIEIISKRFHIRRVEYSHEYLAELRRLYNTSHSFFRHGDYIYISPMEGEQLDIGKPVELEAHSETEIASSLIKHIFFRTFREKFPDIVPLDFYPFRILSRKRQDDLLLDVLPESLKGVLSLKKLIEIQFRTIQLTGHAQFGALINVYYRWQLDKTCKELCDEGFGIVGLSVLTSQSLPGLQGILAPDESLVGAVKSIDGKFAIVESNEGEQRYKLEELFLHKSAHNIHQYLAFKLGETQTEQVLERVHERDETRLSARAYYSEVQGLAKTISGAKYCNLDGFEFGISALPQPVGERFDLQDPTFIFDYSPGVTHNNASIGLVNHGPYDSSTFDMKHPKILVICNKANRGAFSEFSRKLKQGIPSSAYFKGGMIGKYRLHDMSFEIVDLDNYTVEEYRQQITNQMSRQDALPNLAIIETSDQFRHYPTEQNPYHNVRAYFLGLGIPVQAVKADNIRKTDSVLQWIIESIALQIYAKLGGKPWVLPASTSIDNEIIVGIGSTLLRPNLLVGNPHERIVGITTFFTGDGRYLFGSRCKEVPYEQYFDELLGSLRQSIGEISSDYGWREDSVIRLTFHIFKPIKNIEADVVERLLTEFPQYRIQYCFVTISDTHPYLMFDTSQTGSGDKHKGAYVPLRGQNWVLDNLSCLLQLQGPSDMKTSKHRFSNPVLIKIHEKSTYRDLNTVTQQVLNFTNLSWRGFHPARQPATILYSELIAQHLSQLKKISGWKPEIVNSVLKSKKWFL